MVRSAQAVARAGAQRRSWTPTCGCAGGAVSYSWRRKSSGRSRQELECVAAVAHATAQATAQQVQQTKERQRQAEASCMSFAYHILARARTDREHYDGQLALTDGCGGTPGAPPATSCFAMIYQYVSDMLEAAWRRGDARSEFIASSSAASSECVIARPGGPAVPGLRLTHRFAFGALNGFWRQSQPASSQQDEASVGAATQAPSCFALVYLYMAWGGRKAASKRNSASGAAAVGAAVAITARSTRRVSFALEDHGFAITAEYAQAPQKPLIALPDLPRSRSKLSRPSLSLLMATTLQPAKQVQVVAAGKDVQRPSLATSLPETATGHELQRSERSKRNAAIHSAAQRSHSDCARAFLSAGRRADGPARGGWRSRVVPLAAAPLLMVVPAFLACDFTASAVKLVALMHVVAMMSVCLSSMATDEPET